MRHAGRRGTPHPHPHPHPQPHPHPHPQPLTPNPNPNQAVGRIRRYGQQRTVQLYRLLVDATIDTDIFLERRGAEAEALLQATDQPVEPMDED